MSPQDIASVLKALEGYSTCCILGHEDPDADCLGSQRAMGSWLERRGKTVYLCSVGPWSRPEITDWQPIFDNRIPTFPPEESVLTILMDCSSPERTGFKSSEIPAGPTLVIDHHAAGSQFGDFRLVDPDCPATTLLVQNVIEAAGDKPTSEEAGFLFLGFCTDTGFFRHLDSGKAKYLEAVARLVEIGASPSETFRLLAGGRKLGSRRLLGRALDRAELYFDGRVVMTWETWKDWRDCGSERDSDMLYQLLTSIAGVEAAVVIREQNDGICVVSLRSTSDLDVSDIASFFGGGGHRKASGCSFSGDRHDTAKHLLQILADRLDSRN